MIKAVISIGTEPSIKIIPGGTNNKPKVICEAMAKNGISKNKTL
jgi:hypothetical protein